MWRPAKEDQMRLSKRDLIATSLVAAAVLVYLLWEIGGALPGLGSIRATGIAILAFGFAASASAVVPTFDQLLHGNKAYLAVTSLLGVVAVIGGLATLVAESGTGLGLVMAAMVVLWLIATVHHLLLAQTTAPVHATKARHASRHEPHPPALSH
jgi:hypothetical protein